jgi:hypothetical protein
VKRTEIARILSSKRQTTILVKWAWLIPSYLMVYTVIMKDIEKSSESKLTGSGAKIALVLEMFIDSYRNRELRSYSKYDR